MTKTKQLFDCFHIQTYNEVIKFTSIIIKNLMLSILSTAAALIRIERGIGSLPFSKDHNI